MSQFVFKKSLWSKENQLCGAEGLHISPASGGGDESGVAKGDQEGVGQGRRGLTGQVEALEETVALDLD